MTTADFTRTSPAQRLCRRTTVTLGYLPALFKLGAPALGCGTRDMFALLRERVTFQLTKAVPREDSAGRRRHAWLDAGLAAFVPSHHRSRRAQSRRAAGDLALDRRADPHHELSPRSAPARCGWRSGSNATASNMGDRVATLAWNTWRHLECWYGIMGIGAVYHTVNPRLFPDQIAWIVNHAEDRVMMVDLTFLPILEKLADKLKPIERYVVLTDAAHMPATPLRNAVALRGMACRESTAISPGRIVRRKHRRRHVLHLRHHRQSQGRRLFASLERVAFADGGAARRHGRVLARRRHAGGADVSRQLLGRSR